MPKDKSLESRIQGSLVGVSREQQAAILRTFELGERLLQSSYHEEIVSDYKNGMTQPEIARKYIPNQLDLSEGVARGAIYFVIKNTGILNDEERRRLELEHKSQNSKRLWEMGGTLIGLNDEKIAEIRAKQSKSSKQVYKRTLAKIPYDQQLKNAKKASVMGTRARGFLPWIAEGFDIPELDYAKQLAQNPKYKRGSSSDATKIAAELNRVYHNGAPIRTPRAIVSMLQKYREPARKIVSWGTSEEEYARKLSVNPDYRWGSGVNNKKIAEELNVIYHDSKPVRTKYSVMNRLSNLKTG